MAADPTSDVRHEVHKHEIRHRATKTRRDLHGRVVSVEAASYEELLATIPADDVAAGWARRMRARYLDTSPVAHRLSPRDPRRTIGDARQPDGEGRR